ncbi:glycoside hydrolase family 43 protein [Dothistroma septosporum NZE10]|uniref:Endo-1,5-alpha-L-arabinanase A n=1 Tax=Dothistroma septosporum (strain NZE10 / CBS 128990) TaxID=675120 RepID=N1Q185_DOTSN|nr:glycoside hydrolase family 43 protein [Dothistroma septosporum NZE10]
MEVCLIYSYRALHREPCHRALALHAGRAAYGEIITRPRILRCALVLFQAVCIRRRTFLSSRRRVEASTLRIASFASLTLQISRRMLNKVALTTLGLLSVFAQAQYAQPQYRATVQYAYPQACTGVCVDTHDPSIIRRESDGLYFRFSTGGLISIHTAPNITGPWTFACKMLSTNSKVTQKDNPGSDLWAPDVSLVGDTYYVYYSVSTFGTQDSGIGLAKSTSMDCGTFTDAGSVGISSREGFPYNAIDANLLNDGGVYRITFGSFWNNLYQVQMSSPLTKTSSSSAQLAYDPAGLHQMESPSLIKVGSYYYLLSSVGQCCGFDTTPAPPGTEYHIKVCRSKSPNSGFVSIRAQK